MTLQEENFSQLVDSGDYYVKYGYNIIEELLDVAFGVNKLVTRVFKKRCLFGHKLPVLGKKVMHLEKHEFFIHRFDIDPEFEQLLNKPTVVHFQSQENQKENL
jgi:hypothetical protein